MSKQFVIQSRTETQDGQRVPLGSREEIVSSLSGFNTMAEVEGGDTLWGPGIKIELPPEEAASLLEEYGLKQSGLERLITESYSLLGLITYLTTGEKETRAWTILDGTKAPGAAGVIHSDFERGFIAADTIFWKELEEAGSYPAAREQGKVRIEGKEYVVQDGDVMDFKFNV